MSNSKQRVRVVHPTPNIKKGVSYWQDQVPATVDGVLGGFGNGTLPRIDSIGSRSFLLRVLPRLSNIPPSTAHPKKWSDEKIEKRGGKRRAVTRALDCGAGVGRVSENTLLPIIDIVHLVEPVDKFLKEAARLSPTWQPLKNSPSSTPFSARKAAHFHLSVLQDLDPSKPYSTSSQSFTLDPTVSPSRTDSETETETIDSETEKHDELAKGLAISKEEPFKFDVIWCQWLLQHASDNDLLSFLKRARLALKEPESNIDDSNLKSSISFESLENESQEEKELRIRKEKLQIEIDHGAGVIFVKENVCSEESDGTERVIWDDEDSSMTRSTQAYERVFSEAGLTIIRTEVQLGLPKELFAVKSWALR